MELDDLIQWIKNSMSMSEIYQPLIIEYLLKNEGIATKNELAQLLTINDYSVIEYYRKILMNWPYKTLRKHKIIEYDKHTKVFKLNVNLNSIEKVNEAKVICRDKIDQWLDKHPRDETQITSSVRYQVLKESNQRCSLCGIHSSLSPLDVDHIVPKSMADKHGNIVKNGEKMNVDDVRNLQTLCFRCNRAKRNTDNTDFRFSKQKLVRDRIPEIIEESGRHAIIEILSSDKMKDALLEKLIEEHAELINNYSIDEIIDMIEVLIALGKNIGFSEDDLFDSVKNKRACNGAFNNRFFLKGILNTHHAG